VARDRAVERRACGDRPGIGDARRLDHDAREVGEFLTLAPVMQALERLLQRVAERAAQATRVEEHDIALAAAIDEHVIEPYLAQFVDDDCGVGERRILQQP
jgi:hypothetical protein